MRHTWSISDSPDLPIRAFRKALGKYRPDTLEGGKGGAPQAPDPYVSAGAQYDLNRKTALLNKAMNLGNYSNPFGGQNTYVSGYEGGNPVYQTDISANPQLQALLNQQLGAVGQTSGNLNNAFGGIQNAIGQYNGLNQAMSGIGQQLGGLQGQLSMDDVKRAQEQGQNAAYASQAQYLDPQFSQQAESLSAKLAAQGLAPGSQAYNNAMTNFNNQKQQAYSNAQNQSILTGSQLGAQNLQNQLSGISSISDLLKGQYGVMQGQGSNIGQEAALYGQLAGLGQIPYSNLQSIAGLIPGYSGPATSQAGGTDIMSAINNQYQGQLGQYNAKQQANNATTSSIAGLAGMAAMMFF